ncbi:hypothetical protein [Candidatus Nasuia deltocephalinicola]|uniref:hypothetical protein n=1 Tax=Candidatus Nasuia deltocephalincola TaxID=1160784 RepID=UPI00216B1721|nr:hypothetical protein [Candidatus Nasuia deltocephalinicola]
MKNFNFIYFYKKNLFFLKKYIFELYLDIFNFKFLKKNIFQLKNLKKEVKIIKNIIKIKLNENFIRRCIKSKNE